MNVDRAEWSIAGTTTRDREWFTIICQYLIIQHSIDWFSELPRYHRNLLFLTYKMDAVVRIADYRLVNILWLKIMHWVAFRCAWYLVVPQTGYIYSHYLFSSPGFYGTTVVNVLPEINKNGYIPEWKYYFYYFSRSLPSYPMHYF
jgi:hypothetical protein